MILFNKPVGFCGNCGSQLYVGEKFCHECGAQISQSNSSIVNEALTEVLPTNSSVSNTPYFKGYGQQVTPKFSLKQGLAIFYVTHDGRGHFGVTLLDAQGNRIPSLVNVIGKFNGSKALGIKLAGFYLLDIHADGNWTVKIEQ